MQQQHHRQWLLHLPFTRAQLPINPIFMFLFVSGSLIILVGLLSWDLERPTLIDQAARKQTTSSAGSMLSFIADSRYDDNRSGPLINSARQDTRAYVQLKTQPIIVNPFVPAFTIVCSDTGANSTLLEIIGSIRFHHPNSHILVLTTQANIPEKMLTKIHSLSHVHHLSSETLLGAFQTLSPDIHPLMAAYVTAEKYANAIVLPEGHFITSSVADVNREIAIKGVVSKTSGLTPGMYLFGFSRDSTLFTKMKEILSTCHTSCSLDHEKMLREAWVMLSSEGQQKLILPLAVADYKREFYSKKLVFFNSKDEGEVVVGGYKEEPVIKITRKPKPTYSKKPKAKIKNKRRPIIDRDKQYEKTFLHTSFSHKQLSSYTILTPESGKVTIAMLVPSTSKGSDSIDELPIFDALLQSMVDTITEEEKKMMKFIIYLGYDEGDELYDNNMGLGLFKDLVYEKLVNSPISLKAYKMIELKGAPCWIWNELLKIAYEDGADYFYQINDDVVLEDKGWATDFVLALQTNPVLSNLGVVGPVDYVNPKTMTQSFVHRSHFDIFNSYYPPKFRNWYSDDWMTHVYGKSSTFCSKEHFIRNLNIKGQRYKEDGSHRSLVAPELDAGCDTIKDFLSNRGRNPSNYDCHHERMYWERPTKARRKQRKRRRR